MARTVGLSSLPTADRLPFEGWFLKAGNNGSGPLFGATLDLGQFTPPAGRAWRSRRSPLWTPVRGHDETTAAATPPRNGPGGRAAAGLGAGDCCVPRAYPPPLHPLTEARAGVDRRMNRTPGRANAR